MLFLFYFWLLSSHYGTQSPTPAVKDDFTRSTWPQKPKQTQYSSAFSTQSIKIVTVLSWAKLNCPFRIKGGTSHYTLARCGSLASVNSTITSKGQHLDSLKEINHSSSCYLSPCHHEHEQSCRRRTF